MTPPAIWPVVVKLLTWSLPPRQVGPALGDLLEDYEARSLVGRRRAEWWLLRESLSLAVSFLLPVPPTYRASRSFIGKVAIEMRHTWRAIRSRPAATAATVVVLAFGIGLVSSMFALADPYVLRPLPYAKPDELAVLSPLTMSPRNLPSVSEWRDRRQLFTGLAVAGQGEAPIVDLGQGPVQLRLAPISDDYFSVLGVPLTLPENWRPAGASAETPLVLTDSACARLFGGLDPTHQVLRTAEPGRLFRVVGVLPSSFVDPFTRAGVQLDGFLPLGDQPLVRVEVFPNGTRSTTLSVVARLAAGVTPQLVQSVLSTAQRDARGVMPSEGMFVRAEWLNTRLKLAVRPLALGALAAGALILIVCAANVANLLLVRGASRTREFASREVLGASRVDLARLVMIELGLLTLAGIVSGLALAKIVLAAVSLVIPVQYVALGAPALSLRTMAFACGAGGLVMCGGLVPAWAAWRLSPLALFGQASAGDGRGVRLLRLLMTTAQTSVAVVLIVGASLLGRSYYNLIAQDPGYSEDTLAFRVSYPTDGWPQRGLADVDATLDRLRRLPGVLSAAMTSSVLVDGMTMLTTSGPIVINGAFVRGDQKKVSREFFVATNSRLVVGSLPSVDQYARAMVISESFARRCCGEASPLGLVATIGRESFEIVGVIKDVYTNALDEPPNPAVFLPLSSPISPFMNYVLRAEHEDPALATAVARQIHAVRPEASVADGSTMRERLMRSVNDRSFATLLVVFFAVAAIGVSAAGLVGVVGFVIARRTREMAIRLAIGATAGSIQRLVVRETVIASTVGAGVGFTGAVWAARGLQAFLYGITPADPLSFVLAAVVIVAIVAIASWVPAARATRLSPTTALRAE